MSDKKIWLTKSWVQHKIFLSSVFLSCWRISRLVIDGLQIARQVHEPVVCLASRST